MSSIGNTQPNFLFFFSIYKSPILKPERARESECSSGLFFSLWPFPPHYWPVWVWWEGRGCNYKPPTTCWMLGVATRLVAQAQTGTKLKQPQWMPQSCECLVLPQGTSTDRHQVKAATMDATIMWRRVPHAGGKPMADSLVKSKSANLKQSSWKTPQTNLIQW